jgi:minor extracellular serine protease Vpr
MKKSILYGLCLCFSICATAQHNNPGLSPLTRQYLSLMNQSGGKTLPAGYVYKTGNDGLHYVSALVQVKPDITQQQLDALGIKTGTHAGNVWTMQIPVDKVSQFTQLAGLSYVQLDEPVFPAMDSVRRLTRVDSVHAGLGGLPMPYSGEGVVVGVIDAGFDYRHPSLFDTSGAHYRVMKIWEQKKAGVPPSGFSYGNEITDTLDMWAAQTDLIMSHGAHVTGIAAGSGVGSDSGTSNFRGIAYASDLVLVGIKPDPSNWTTTGMSDIIDGMNYIYTYAASVGKPAVVNLSWGGCIGPHDGLSLFGQACDNLTGEGKLFVCSAGNNGDQAIHLQKIFTATDTAVHTVVQFDAALGEKRTWVDIWGDSSQSMCIKLSLYTGTNLTDEGSYICLDGQLHQVYLIGTNGISSDTMFATVTTAASEFNGKPRIFLEIYSKVTQKVLISLKGNEGIVNMWTGFVKDTRGYYGNFAKAGLSFATAGDKNMTIGDMASTRSAIAVAAYSSKTIFTNVDGGVEDYGLYAAKDAIAPFSSLGPAADGRVKPDIAGPGLIVGSAVSSYDPEFQTAGASYTSVVRIWPDPVDLNNYSYAMLMGTSMSSPAVSGVTALMLQANPGLTPAQAIKSMAETAILDGFTGSLPAEGNNTWGHGKINAMGAIKRATTFLGTGDHPGYSGSSSFYLFPNPASDLVTIGYKTRKAGVMVCEVYDAVGRKSNTIRWSFVSGDNKYQIDTRNWAKGFYLVKLSGASEMSTLKLVVQ